MKNTPTKRISFDEDDMAHLYEMALEHLCHPETHKCFTCEKLRKRIQTFLGDKTSQRIYRVLKRNGYCNRLKGFKFKDL